jgi:hypothetical protein
MMKKGNVENYFSSDNHALGELLVKLNQLKQWNSWLEESLANEKTLLTHCQIVGLSGTSLIAIADSAHWVTRLRFYIPDLLPKLRKYHGLEKIESISCKVQPNIFSIAPQKKSLPQQKLSEKNAAMLLATAEKMSDKKLRAVLEKIASYSISE